MFENELVVAWSFCLIFKIGGGFSVHWLRDANILFPLSGILGNLLFMKWTLYLILEIDGDFLSSLWLHDIAGSYFFL